MFDFLKEKVSRGKKDKPEIHHVRGAGVEFELKYLKKILRICYKYGYQLSLRVGAQAALLAKRGILGFAFFTKRVSKKPLTVIKRNIDAAAVAIKHKHDVIVHPLQRIVYGAELIRKNIKRHKELGYKTGFHAFAVTFFMGIKHNSGVLHRSFLSFLNYIAPIAAVTGLILVVQYTAGLTYALNVNYNGSDIGYIEKEAVFETAAQRLKQRLIYVDGDTELDDSVKFKMKVISDTTFREEDQLVNAMISVSDQDFIEAYGLYIDGEFYGATADGNVVRETLDNISAKNLGKNKNTTVEFVQSIETKQGLYLTEGIIEPEEVSDLLNSETQGRSVYTVTDGDTFDAIASKNNLSAKELLHLNPGLDKKVIYPGDEVLTSNSKPFLTVKMVKEIKYRVRVPYTKTEIQDTTKLKGTRNVVQKGVNGKNRIKARVEYIDGVEEKRTILSTVTLQKPVNEKIVVGTRQPDINHSIPGSSGSGSLSGISFGWPTSGGSISQGYHGWHRAIDVPRPHGTPVYASAPGKVIMSTVYGGYGRCLVIDHGNGVRTRYAHNSANFVSPGTWVERGQKIASVGSTGNSTGNHLHFEIISGGRQVNPMSYLRR
ncbi:MAG: peptidoglycan DD-metalloendopeptidase family protein [Oscillospiraceae bacterium]|nr:peptidoglycan DD-metalloendopeptidase family protein [Oscillospiraceae bacterium]